MAWELHQIVLLNPLGVLRKTNASTAVYINLFDGLGPLFLCGVFWCGVYTLRYDDTYWWQGEVGTLHKHELRDVAAAMAERAWLRREAALLCRTRV